MSEYIILLLFTLLILLGILSAAFYKLKKMHTINNSIEQTLKKLQARLISVEEDTASRYKEQFKSWCIVQEKSIRKDAVTRSRKIMRGQATEHLAPLMLKELNAKDFRFIGNPIDFIVFSGVSDITDSEADEIDKIIFLDIKTGSSKLSKVQRRIRDCIKEKKVEFLEYNPDKDQETKNEQSK